MSSANNRRLRGLKRRHERAEQRLVDRLQTFEHAARTEPEPAASLARGAAKLLREQLDALIVAHASAFRKRDSGAVRAWAGGLRWDGKRRLKDFLAGGWRPPFGPTAPPAPEKLPPKVHGVNAQREDKRRPQVGGARGKKA